MKKILPLFVFIDACGWEIIKDRPFARGLAPLRQRLDSVFGYSSACVPSILSGAWPSEHRNWCYFVYDPENSPFKKLKPLRWLPSAVTGRRIFRRYLSKAVKASLKFKGYFDLYNIPFQHISLFDFSEKKSPLQPGGMNRGGNIFDHLEGKGVPYHVSQPARTEEENLIALEKDIASESIDFAFLYWADLDGLLHRVGNLSPEIEPKLAQYEAWMQRLVAHAKNHYEEVHLYVFSDHGMANCDVHIDLKKQVEQLPVEFAKDYAVVYDSTMARFWFFNDAAREQICSLLSKVPEGRMISDDELKEMHTFFPDRHFGELIFLMKEGVLIVPSHMGERPIRAMHGYHPTDPQSYAVLMTNQPTIDSQIQAIPDVYRLMVAEVEQVQAERASKSKASYEPIRSAAGM